MLAKKVQQNTQTPAKNGDGVKVESQKGIKTYNTRDSLVVTDPTTDLVIQTDGDQGHGRVLGNGSGAVEGTPRKSSYGDLRGRSYKETMRRIRVVTQPSGTYVGPSRNQSLQSLQGYGHRTHAINYIEPET
jgi:hypothetical protein